MAVVERRRRRPKAIRSTSTKVRTLIGHEEDRTVSRCRSSSPS
jgi:hypothetical protein